MAVSSHSIWRTAGTQWLSHPKWKGRMDVSDINTTKGGCREEEADGGHVVYKAIERGCQIEQKAPVC